MDAFISQSHQKHCRFVTNQLKTVDLPRPAAFSIGGMCMSMLNVAGLGRSTIFQSVRDGPSMFLVEPKDKCIHRSSHVTGHSQVASILQESGAIPH